MDSFFFTAQPITYVTPFQLRPDQFLAAQSGFGYQSGFEYQNFASNPNNYENNFQFYVENDNTIDDELNIHEIINMNVSQTVLNDNYDELDRESFHSRNKRKGHRRVRVKSKVNFKLFCLPHGDPEPKIPRM